MFNSRSKVAMMRMAEAQTSAISSLESKLDREQVTIDAEVLDQHCISCTVQSNKSERLECNVYERRLYRQ